MSHLPSQKGNPEPLAATAVASSERVFLRGLPLVGNTLRFAANPLAWILHVGQYPGLVRVAGIGKTVYFHAHDPRVIEEVLVEHNQSFIKSVEVRRDMRDLFGQGLLTSSGNFWLRQRRLAQPAFHRERIAGYGKVMIEEAQNLLAAWQNGDTRDIHHDMMRLAQAVVLRTIFSTAPDEERDRLGAALNAVLMRFTQRGVVRLVESTTGKPLPTPTHRTARLALQQIDATIQRIVDEHCSGDHEQDDLLSMLMAARDEEGDAMSNQQLRDECVTLFVGGHETTALALTWTLYQLSHAPQVVAKLHQEFDSVLGLKLPSVDDMPHLTYTANVIQESMRLYPPAWVITREANEDVIIDGQRIPKGSTIVMSPYALHRNPRYYNRPDEFIPERWVDDLARRLPRFAYFPFGGGSRQCIGNQFAMMEAILVTACILQQWDVADIAHQAITLEPSITLRPKAGPVLVVRSRNKPS